MFASLPESFRKHGIDADARTLLLLQKSLELGLVQTIGDLFVTLKSILVKDPKDSGPFAKAYYDYFLNILIEPGQSLDDAVAQSDSFDTWKQDFLRDHPEHADKDLSWFIQRYLDEIHTTSFDIKSIIDGQSILDKDNPDMIDKGGGRSNNPKPLDRMSDFRNIDMDELLERMNRVRKQQTDEHQGGDHWIGQGGISPYGNSGAAQGGIRIGGSGGSKMARKVINDPRYFPVDLDAQINDDNMDAALASLKGVIEESAHQELDVENTIDKGLKRGGLFIPEIKDITDEKLQVILLIDNGGYSMDPFISIVSELFRKMKTRFAHDLKTYYFHNTVYDRVYEDERRIKAITIDKFIDHDPNYCIFIVGDAAMAPYEVTKLSVSSWRKIKKKFKKIAWINPEPKRYWHHTMTIQFFSELFKMYTMTPKGMEEAILSMNQKKFNS